MYKTFMAASQKEREEIIVQVEWDYIDSSNGFTYDIGGSVIKLAYVSKEDWAEPKDRKPGSNGCVRLINFAREELTEAFDFINTKVHLKRSSPDETIQIYSSGIGGTEFSQQFKNNVNAKNMNCPETDCFTHAFEYLIHHIPRKDLLHPIYKPAFATVRKEIQRSFDMLEKMKGKTAMLEALEAKPKQISIPQETKVLAEGEMMTDEKDLYPCGILMCGSGFGMFMLKENGTFQYMDMSNRAGRMFLGLGALLTGAETFEELMDLCERGCAGNVSVTVKTITENMAKTDKKEDSSKEGDDEDMYKMWLEQADDDLADQAIFCFGQAVGKKLGDFKREDLARCLLETIVLDLVQFALSAAGKMKLKHVFFCGGFPIHPLMRQLITMHWVRRDAGNNAYDPESTGYIQPHFLVHGQSLGALGAFLNHRDQWSEKMAQQAKEQQQANEEKQEAKEEKQEVKEEKQDTKL